MIHSLTVSSNPSILPLVPECISKLILSIPYKEKCVSLILRLFDPIQNGCRGILGLKEILFDRVKPIHESDNLILKSKIEEQKVFLHECLFRAEYGQIPYGFTPLHGVLFISSGLCGLVSNLSSTAFFGGMAVAGNLLFACANVVALDQNISLYSWVNRIDITHLPAYNTGIVQSLKKSAILGMVSNLNYLLVPFCFAIGCSTGILITLGTFAVTTGCCKIIYDYFTLK